ncbi:hypothetical protein ACFYSF_23120, partial [Streptomyces canus]
MVTFAQAQERAEEWINGDVPSYQHREVRVREFDLGFVVWAEDRAEGPRSDGGAQRLVIARDSGEATLWPSLPVGEVIRRYEETYGREDGVEEAGGASAASRVDLNQTSFLLTPPEWLQDAADKLGIGGDGVSSGARDGGAGEAGSGAGSGAAPGVPAGARPWTGADTNGGEDLSVALPETVFSAPVSGGGSGSATDEEASSALEGSEVVEVSEGVDVQEVSETSEISDSRTARISGGAGSSSGVREEGTRGVTPPGASSYGYPQGPGGSGAGVGPASASSA